MSRKSVVKPMNSNSAFVPELQGQVKALILLIAQSGREYFKDEENRKKFEQWYEQRYGKPYEWTPVKRRA